MFTPCKESYDQPRQHIKKQRHYFAAVHLVKAMVFPVYGCESWNVKKAESWRIDAFELWCWRRLLRVPWIAKRSNQSILKEISPKYSLEGLMLKLKLQYFGHLMWWTDSLEKTQRPWCWERLKAGGEEDNRGWNGWIASPTLWTWRWVNSGSWWWTGKPGKLQSMGSQSQTLLSELNWTESELISLMYSLNKSISLNLSSSCSILNNSVAHIYARVSCIMLLLKNYTLILHWP